MAHKRRFDFAEKLAFYVATLAFGSMMAMQTNYTSNIAKTSRENHDELIGIQAEMKSANSEMGDIKDNQKDLFTEVTGIKGKLSKMCDRQNLYWEGHKIECE